MSQESQDNAFSMNQNVLVNNANTKNKNNNNNNANYEISVE